MRLREFLSEAKKPVPKMTVPGVKVRMLQSWRGKLEKAVKELGHTVEMSGYEDGSTVWAVAFDIDKKFDIDAFEDKLRDKLHFDGWVQVKFFDLVEE